MCVCVEVLILFLNMPIEDMPSLSCKNVLFIYDCLSEVVSQWEKEQKSIKATWKINICFSHSSCLLVTSITNVSFLFSLLSSSSISSLNISIMKCSIDYESLNKARRTKRKKNVEKRKLLTTVVIIDVIS